MIILAQDELGGGGCCPSPGETMMVPEILTNTNHFPTSSRHFCSPRVSPPLIAADLALDNVAGAEGVLFLLYQRYWLSLVCTIRWLKWRNRAIDHSTAHELQG